MENVSIALFPWFDNNLFKSNPDKFDLIISNIENLTVHNSEYEIENNKCEKLFDWKINFDDYISDTCRIPSLIALSKGRILINSFFNSPFSYCPLIWMCDSRTNKNKIA